MRKFAKHTPEQIVVKLEKVEALRGEGMSTAQACRVLGISEATLFRWRQHGEPDHEALWFPSNLARNSPMAVSKSEFRSLELQGFRAVSTNYRIELRATFGGEAGCNSEVERR